MAVMTKIIPKNTKKYEQNQKLITAIKETSDESKGAVREKWLTYCKTQFVNQIMNWRLEFHQLDLSDYTMLAIKMKFGFLKSLVKEKFKFRDGAGYIVKKFDHLGPKIDMIYPLVNPDLFWSEALA